MPLLQENVENAKSAESKKPGKHRTQLNQPPITNPVNQRQSAAEPVSTATFQPQLAAEPASRATGCQPQLGPAVVVVENTAQGHMVPVPVDTTTTDQTLLAQHQQTGDDLPLTLISPARDNSPKDEPHTKEDTFSNAYSFMLHYIVIIYIYIYLDSLM